MRFVQLELREPFTVVLARADPNVRSHDGSTALHCAVGKTDTVFIEDLLAHAATDVNARDNDSASALCLAVRWNRPAAAALLLASPKLDMASQNRRGLAVLDVAMDTNRPAMVRLIEDEMQRRDRVAARVRLYALFLRVRAGTAAPTPATLALLGPVGSFIFDDRCLDELVPDMVCWAATTPRDDPRVPTTGSEFSSDMAGHGPGGAAAVARWRRGLSAASCGGPSTTSSS